jgi:hypothetical protein
MGGHAALTFDGKGSLRLIDVASDGEAMPSAG